MLAIWAKLGSRPGLHVRGAAPRSVLVGCPFAKKSATNTLVLQDVLGILVTTMLKLIHELR